MNKQEIISVRIDPFDTVFDLYEHDIEDKDEILVRFYGLDGKPIGFTNNIYRYKHQDLVNTYHMFKSKYVVEINKYTDIVHDPLTDNLDNSLCDITRQAKALLDKSDLKGIEKYGMTLDDNNIDNFLTHAQEECGDMLKYLTKAKQVLKDFCKLYPNDQDLGKEFRKIYG